MRYTNSQKISERYLMKEKDKIRKILDENDFPFMEEYRQRLEQISLVTDGYEALKKILSLSDELNAPDFFKPYEAYFIEKANIYVKECQSSYHAYKRLSFFQNVLLMFPVGKIGCLTKLQSLARDFYIAFSTVEKFDQGLYYKLKYVEEMVWFWEGIIQYSDGKISRCEAQLFTLMSVMMELPDEQAFQSAFYLLTCSSSDLYRLSSDWRIPSLRTTPRLREKMRAFHWKVSPALRAIICSENEVFLISPYVCNCLMGCIHYLPVFHLKTVAMMFDKLGNSEQKRLRNKHVYPRINYTDIEAYRKIVDVFIKYYEADSENTFRKYLINNVTSYDNGTTAKLEEFYN